MNRHNGGLFPDVTACTLQYMVYKKSKVFGCLHIHTHRYTRTCIRESVRIYKPHTQGPIQRPKRMISSLLAVRRIVGHLVAAMWYKYHLDDTFASSLSFLLLICFLSHWDIGGLEMANGYNRYTVLISNINIY
jgi:hypothetical protein